MAKVTGIEVVWWEYQGNTDSLGGVAFYKDVTEYNNHKKRLLERDTLTYRWVDKSVDLITRELTEEQELSLIKNNYIWLNNLC